ncbi:MAG: DUF427 domain-containing protein [Micromonosporaceae bacterium]
MFLERIRVEPYLRRVRGMLDGRTVVDSERAVLLLDPQRLPVYYFPASDVTAELLADEAAEPSRSRYGEVRRWSLRSGGRLVADAAWSYPRPAEGLASLRDLVAFRWDVMDSWYEEDDEVFVHPREPYCRVDVLHSSRHVRVEVAGETVAESSRPRMLFETGLPVRYYLPAPDVRQELLRPSATTTQCPYKGVASYWSVTVGSEVLEDVVWAYRFPVVECPKIAGLFAFYNEQVDLWVDGVLQERPKTLWS